MILKKYFMKSVDRITKDFKQKELLPLKLVFFVQASTISVLYPYLTIHMRELGINVEEAAIMSAVIPVIGIIMPPLAGMVADKIGNFKLLLAFFSLIGGAASLLLLLVPVGRVTVTYPERITLDFGCGLRDYGSSDAYSKYFQVGFSPDIPCEQSPGLNGSDHKDFGLDTKLEACGFVCSSGNQTAEPMDFESDIILKGRSYSIQTRSDSDTSIHHYNLEKGDVPRIQTKEDILSHRIMSNDDHLGKSIRRLAPSEYFFPAADLSKLSCTTIRDDQAKDRYVCSIEVPGEEAEDFAPTINISLKFDLKKVKGDDGNRYISEFAGLSSLNRSNFQVTCGPKPNGKNVSAFVYLHNPENNLEVLETLSLSDCEPRCLVSTTRKNICTNMKEEVVYDPELTFWIYLVIRVFIGIIGSTSYAMYEVAVIAILREQNADYGLQRIYASIGGMISSPLSGLLIDYASQGKGYTDFRPAFYLYAGLKTGTSVLMLFINLEFKKAASNVISDAIQVLKNLEVIALLMACFVLGTAWGYIESFLFWFLEDLGGTRSLMGITITVGGIAGIPLLVLSGPIIDKIGHANVLFIGFVFYAIRLVGYSIIYNPYHCLFFEAMESITSSLAITAAVTYAAKLSTTTTDGSIQGLVGGLYFGVGRGAGSLIGGYLMKAFGTRPTYRIFAVFSIVTGIVYYLFNQFYIRKRPQREGNEICKKEPKPKKNLDSEVQVITEKPRSGSKEYGAIQTENNNTTGAEKNKSDEGEKEKEDKEKDDKEKESHSNPGYVPDDEENNSKNQPEIKKKED